MADKQKRPYTFRNQAYWEAKRAPRTANNIPVLVRNDNDADDDWEPASFDISRASTAYSSGSARTGSSVNRGTKIGRNAISDALTNLKDLPLPYQEKGGKINIKEAINIVKRTYANIAVFRNCIDIMTEFSCADTYLTGGNAASRAFVEKWFKKIGLPKFMEYFFREFYTSGNVFILRFDGAFADEDFKKVKTLLAAVKNKIPLRYTILNPQEIMIFTAATFENAPYRKVLSEYELQALRQRRTDEDKALYKALPDDVKRQVDSGAFTQEGVYMPIPAERLYTVFYKKQPYEPFAVPFGYPVLRDLNHKEELKKIDQAISRTIDNVILLVTMGEKKDEHGNGMNPAAMAKMQELLQTESVGRVLVSDYSTKMTFVIPQIGEILNPEKYEIVNRDIAEGLLNVLAADDKFANGLMKAQIFLERLKEGRKAFLAFIQQEVDNICKTVGFKAAPTVNFQEIDLKDEVQFNKVYTRLLEIGVLTPEQGIRAMQTGVLPEAEDMLAAQEAYVEQRKQGKWNPLLGGVPMAISPDAEKNRALQKELGDAKMAQQAAKGGASNPNATNNGRPAGSSGTPKSSTTPAPAGTSTASVAELAKTKHLVSLTKLKRLAEATSDFMNKVETAVKAKYNLTELSDKQKDLAYRLAASVMSTTKLEDWGTQLEAVVKEPEKHLTSYAQNEISEAVDKLAAEHQIDTYSASILYHSKWQA
jgi:hypothetical protein